MINRTVKVTNLEGIHIGPAGKMCDLAAEYTCHMAFKYRDYGEANVRSILSILGAGVKSGEEIELICDGPDEQAAIDALTALIEANFED